MLEQIGFLLYPNSNLKKFSFDSSIVVTELVFIIETEEQNSSIILYLNK